MAVAKALASPTGTNSDHAGPSAESAISVMLPTSVETNGRPHATDSRNTVFSNYFVAKPPFWKEWLAKNEILFSIAEEGNSDLAGRLNDTIRPNLIGFPEVFMADIAARAATQWHRVDDYARRVRLPRP